MNNMEIQKYYQNEPRFNEVHSRDNLSKDIKIGAYVINLDEYTDFGTHWTALYALNNDITYFDSGNKNFIGNKNIKINIFRIQANNSTMCRYFYTGFIDIVLPGKNLIECIDLFLPYDLKKWQYNFELF